MEPDNQDKTPNMSQPHQGAEIVRDKYCWECNRFIPEVIRKNNCWKCFRSFHGKCLAGYGQLSSRIDPAEWECPICIKLESSKTDFVGKQSVLDLLKYTMNDILKNCAFQELQTYLTNCGNNCDDIVNPIDLNQMKKKTDDRLYDSLEAFIVDAKYIDHNIYLTDRQSSYMRKLCVDNLVQFCEAQIENIKSCAECYENRHKYPEEWRFMACSKPNIVLWTKNFGDRKYWPVKLISIVNDIQIKVVRFDGHSSDFINILPKNCYLFSKDSPAYGKYNLESELKEAKSYIINAAKKFGTFHLAPNRTRFKANQLVTYVKAMYPNYNGPCPYSLEKNGEEMDNGDDNHDVFNSIEDDSDDTEYSEENSGSFSEDSTDDSEIDDPNENESDNGTTTPNRKRCVSSEDINVHINTTSNNNSQEFIEHAETDMDTGIPTKKPRISSENEIKNDTVIQDNHQCDTSIVNVSGLADSTSPSGCNSSATVQDLVQSISQIVQTEAINFEKTNQVKFEAVQNELTVSKEKNAKYERVIKDLNDKLQVVTSERDQNEAKALQEKQIFAKLKLRFEIERQKAKEESAKSQEKLEELSTRIQTIKNEKALENSEAKQSLANLKNDHANDMKTLNQKHQQEVTAKQTKIDDLEAQIDIMTSEKEAALAKAKEEIDILKENHRKSAEQQRQILQIGHQKAMQEFEIKLQKEHVNDQKKSEGEICELKKKNEDLKERLARFSADIETIKYERTVQSKQMSDLEEKHTKSIEKLHKSLEADHQKSMEELKKVHDDKLAEQQRKQGHGNDQEKSQDEIGELKKKNEELKKSLRGRDAIILSLKNTSARTETFMVDLRVNYEKSLEELRENFEADHQKAMEELKHKLAKIRDYVEQKRNITINGVDSQFNDIIAQIDGSLQVHTPIP